MVKNKQLKYTSIKRWLIIFVYSFIIGTLTSYVYSENRLFVYEKLSYLSKHNILVYWVLNVFLNIVFVSAILYLWKLTKQKFSQLKYFYSYPPLSCFILFSIIAFCGNNYFEAPSLANNILLSSSVIMLFLIAIINWPMDTGKSYSIFSNGNKKSLYELFNNPEDYENWLYSSKPIENDKDDYLGYRVIAERIISVLEQDQYSLQHIGIIGDIGSGKSSLLNLVKQHVPPQDIFLTISCWGFATGENLQKHILQSMINELGKNIDCLNLKNLPEDYMHTVTFKTPIINIGIATKKNERKLFELFNKMLQVSNIKMTLVIEDLERASDINDIDAFLYKVSTYCPSCQVIIATDKHVVVRHTTDERNFQLDLHKICNHVEVMPALNGLEVELALRSFVTNQYKKFSDDITFTQNNYNKNLYISKFYKPNWLECVFEINIPIRVLKATMLRTVQSWEILHGEILLEEVFLYSFLAEFSPKCLDILNAFWKGGKVLPKLRIDNIGRVLGNGNNNHDNQEEYKDIYQRILSRTGIKEDMPYFKQLERIIGYLCPIIQKLTTKPSSQYSCCIGHYHHGSFPAGLQSVFNKGRGELYYKRLSTGNIDDHVSDQKVLKAIQQLLNSNNFEISQLFESCYCSEQWRESTLFFFDIIPDNKKQCFVEGYYNFIRTNEKANAEIVDNMAFMFLFKCCGTDNYRDFIINQIKLSLSVSLLMAYELTTVPFNRENYPDKTGKNIARRYIATEAPKVLNTGQKLASSIPDIFDYSGNNSLHHKYQELLYWIFFDTSQEISYEGYNPEKLVIESLEVAPHKMFPYLLLFLINKNNDKGFFYKDEERLDRYFKSYKSDFIRLMSIGYDGYKFKNNLHPDIKVILKNIFNN